MQSARFSHRLCISSQNCKVRLLVQNVTLWENASWTIIQYMLILISSPELESGPEMGFSPFQFVFLAGTRTILLVSLHILINVENLHSNWSTIKVSFGFHSVFLVDNRRTNYPKKTTSRDNHLIAEKNTRKWALLSAINAPSCISTLCL